MGTITERITTIEATINNAVFVLHQVLNSLVFYGSRTITAEQSTGAAGPAPAPLVPEKPVKPVLDMSETSLADPYVTDFVMPPAVSIDDAAPDAGWTFNWQEQFYADWLLSEIKDKIYDGFDDIAIINELETEIWARRDARLNSARTDALDRRQTRWTRRGHDVDHEMLAAREEEAIANFNYAEADATRDKAIKRAELKDDNRKFSVAMGLRGEEIYIGLQEGFAMRSLDAAESVIDLAIRSYEALLAYYTDVTIQEYINKIVYYLGDLRTGLGKRRADIKRYITNTRIISGRNRQRIAEFEGDVEVYATDAYYNEVKARLNMRYNELSLDELIANRDMLLKSIDANMQGFKQAMSTNKAFIDGMGRNYAQYVSSATQSVNLMLQAGANYNKQITS